MMVSLLDYSVKKKRQVLRNEAVKISSQSMGCFYFYSGYTNSYVLYTAINTKNSIKGY